MKHLFALEVLYTAAELQCLIGGRLSQVYQPSKDSLLLQFHLAGKGRSILKVSIPCSAYLVSGKEPAAEVTGFCSLLRSKLGSSTLQSLSQLGFERILQLDFSSKNRLFSLFFELFSKGNIVLVHDSKIVAAWQKQTWSTRTIATGRQYKLPPSSLGPRLLDDKQLLQMLKGTNKTDIVRFLAIEISLGGLYAEELCLLSGIDKKTVPSQITATAAKKLIQSLQKLLNSKSSPSVIYENSSAIDAVPISLGRYKDNEKKPFSTFSEALEVFDASGAAAKPSRYDAEIARLSTIIGKQEEALAAARLSAEKNSRSGKLIYENYQEIKAVLDTFRAGGWAAVKELQKRSKILKSLDEKTGKMVVEMDEGKQENAA